PPQRLGQDPTPLDVRPLLLRVLVTHLHEAQTALLLLALLHPHQPHPAPLPPPPTLKAARAPVPGLGTLVYRDVLLANAFLVLVLLFSAAITPSAPIIKAGIMMLALVAAAIPITSQFLIPALPVLTWVIFFFAAR
ncbi:hypothetical protein V493_07550, partial [Pseudogymnoascus sp. VKM F-4281 (FW-2241)]